MKIKSLFVATGLLVSMAALPSAVAVEKPAVESFDWPPCRSPRAGQAVGLMKHIDSDGAPTTGESELDARKLAAQISGRLGGKAGLGAAVNKRWEAYRARKAAKSGSQPA